MREPPGIFTSSDVVDDISNDMYNSIIDDMRDR
jgi:hypothetical protein